MAMTSNKRSNKMSNGGINNKRFTGNACLQSKNLMPSMQQKHRADEGTTPIGRFCIAGPAKSLRAITILENFIILV
jgi:hypothetical protein